MRRLILLSLFLGLVTHSAFAQPWPAPNPRGSEALDRLLAVAKASQAIEAVPHAKPKAPAEYRISAPGTLTSALAAQKALITDVACDACVLHWRDVVPG